MFYGFALYQMRPRFEASKIADTRRFCNIPAGTWHRKRQHLFRSQVAVACLCEHGNCNTSRHTKDSHRKNSCRTSVSWGPARDHRQPSHAFTRTQAPSVALQMGQLRDSFGPRLIRWAQLSQTDKCATFEEENDIQELHMNSALLSRHTIHFLT